MRDKIYTILAKLYGIVMSIAFIIGFVPVIPFIVALVIGGPAGEKISLFMYDKVYPVAFILASVAVLIGLAAMYVKQEQALSVHSLTIDDDD